MPEQIPNTNMWQLLANEKIVGDNGQEVAGPAMVRVNDFEGVDLHLLQIDSPRGEVKIEINGPFPGSVQKITSPPESTPSK